MDGTETSAVLKDLSSLTEYEIAVFAVYAALGSEPLRGTETTRELHTHLVPYILCCLMFICTPLKLIHAHLALPLDV